MAYYAVRIATRMRTAGLALVLLGITACARSQEGPLRHFDGVSKVNSADEAVARVIALNPELQGFPRHALPPETIETARAPDGGWYVGFIQRGSGRPGIVEARCFELRDDYVVAFSEFHATFGQWNDHVKLASCRP